VIWEEEDAHLVYCDECQMSYMWPVQEPVRGDCRHCGVLEDPRSLVVRDWMPAGKGFMMTWEEEEL
jgi:hypothetical protein